MADSVIDIMLIVGVFGGIGAYITNFMGFKDWVNGFIGGGGCTLATGSTTCNEFKGMTSTQRATQMRNVVAGFVLINAKTAPSQSQVNTLPSKVSGSDVTAMVNGMTSYCNNGCSAAEAQKLWTILRNATIRTASAAGIPIRAIPTTAPDRASTAMAIARMVRR